MVGTTRLKTSRSGVSLMRLRRRSIAEVLMPAAMHATPTYSTAILVAGCAGTGSETPAIANALHVLMMELSTK